MRESEPTSAGTSVKLAPNALTNVGDFVDEGHFGDLHTVAPYLVISAKQSAETNPIYPEPTMHTFTYKYLRIKVR